MEWHWQNSYQTSPAQRVADPRCPSIQNRPKGITHGYQRCSLRTPFPLSLQWFKWQFIAQARSHFATLTCDTQPRTRQIHAHANTDSSEALFIASIHRKMHLWVFVEGWRLSSPLIAVYLHPATHLCLASPLQPIFSVRSVLIFGWL